MKVIEKSTLVARAQLKKFFVPMRIRPDDAAFQDLVESIRLHGIEDDLIIRLTDEERVYEIVDGNRRFAAAEILGIDEVPCEVRDMSDEEAFTVAFVRNIYRSPPDAVSIGNWIQMMMMKFGLGQKAVGERIGKSQSYVSRHLKLLEEWEQTSLTPASEFRARALRAAPEIVKEGAEDLSGREIERKTQEVMFSVEDYLAGKPKWELEMNKESVIFHLKSKCGLTDEEARTTLEDHIQKMKPKRTGPKERPMVTARSRMIAEAMKHYPPELIDEISKLTDTSNLQTFTRYARRYLQALLMKAPDELKQTVLEDFRR